MKVLTEKEALLKLSSYCSSSECCKFDAREKLRRWGISDKEACEKMIARLEAENFIDERRYCRAYVNDKFRYAKWGRQKIRQGLFLKRISPELISVALDEIDRKEYLSVLSGLIRSKSKTLTGKNEYEKRMKLCRFAAGRGFDLEDIREVLPVDDCELMGF